MTEAGWLKLLNQKNCIGIGWRKCGAVERCVWRAGPHSPKAEQADKAGGVNQQLHIHIHLNCCFI
jgi:hypothetical protein